MRTQHYIRTAITCVMAAMIAPCARLAEAAPFSVASRVNTVLTSHDGLPQDTVKSVLQTRDGYVWAATQDGIARFDGTQFTDFDTRNTPGLATNNVEQLAEDSSGDLWIAGDGGVSMMHGATAIDQTPSDAVNSGRRVSLQLDITGRIWVSIAGRIYKDVDHRLVLQVDTHDYTGGEKVTAWAIDTDGSLDVGTDRGSVIQIRHGQAHRFRVPHTGPLPAAITSLVSYPSETIWIGASNGLYVLSGDHLRPYPTAPASGQFSEVIKDKQQTIWVLSGRTLYSVGKHGLLPTSDLKGVAVSHIVLNASRELVCMYGEPGVDPFTYSDFLVNTGTVFIGEKGRDGLSSFVRCAIRDHEGNLWVGTDHGLNCIRDRDCHTFTRADGVPGLPIQNIFNDLGGGLFVSSAKSGLYSVTAAGKFVPVECGLKSISAMIETEKGSVLMLSHGKLFQRVGKTAVDASRQYGISPNEPVVSMCDSNHGDTWITTLNRFIHRGDAGLTDVKVPGPAFWTFVTAVDRQGRFWASTERGLYCVDAHGLHNYGPTDGVSGVIITSIHTDYDGTVWFGHWGGGLTRYKNGRFSHIGVSQGLYSDGVYQILEDHRNNLWIGSSKGIFEVSIPELNNVIDGVRPAVHCFPYGPADGASGSQSFAAGNSSCVTASDGTLWFSGLTGLVRIDPDNIITEAAPVLIEQATIEGKNYTGQNNINVQPGNGSVEFQFAALDYRDPGHLHFQYKLEGFDTSWTETDTNRTASYTNLPPGHYRFVVNVNNSDSLWSNSTFIDFTLLPRFYQTWWFKLLVVVCSLSLVIGYASFKILRLREHNNRLQAMASQLEDQNEELHASQQEVTAARDALEEANARLFAQASTDALTGLTNRRVFIENLDDEWRVGNNVGAPLSLLMIDVDNFKAYNDTFGHPAGDEILRGVARILVASARGGDVVARYGGEEFVIILRNTNEHIAATVAERFRQAIAKSEWPKRQITVSIGAATRTDAQSTPSALISSADIALYSSKEHGRDRITHYSDLPDSEKEMAA